MTGAFLVCLTALVLGALLGSLRPNPRRASLGSRPLVVVFTIPGTGLILSRPRQESLYDVESFNPRGQFYHYIPMFQNFDSFQGIRGRGTPASPQIFDSIDSTVCTWAPRKPYRPARYTFAELERMKSRRS